MSSILTNNSAMVALQTLKSINMSLGKVQSEISTGKTVESAKDNAAVWAISKVMESDVSGFKAISDSLALGQATLGVAINGAEAVTDLLNEIKGKITAAQEGNVDRAKIQADIEAMTGQIQSVVGAAQFNGLNVLNGSDTADVEILSSLDRSSDGSVAASSISVSRSNLTAADQLGDTTAVAGGANGGAATAAVGANATVNFTIAAFDGAGNTVGVNDQIEGIAYSLVLAGGAGDYADLDTGTATVSSEITYVANEGDDAAAIAAGLATAFGEWAKANGVDNLTVATTATPGQLAVTSSGAGNTFTGVQVNVNAADDTDHIKGGGQLSGLSFIDVSTEEGANLALENIEDLIQTSIDTAADLGSSGSRIETQAEFVSKLTDRLTSGIGALVDADMEAASAKLQALQTQQQLGVQALSIANQAPQTILSLFR